MAADTLRQASKRLSKTKKDTDYALDKVQRNFPIVERLRDSFDASHTFLIEFKTFGKDDYVEVTFIFTEAFEHTC